MKFKASFASIHDLWEEEIIAKNQFDAIQKARTIAENYGKRKELEVLYSIHSVRALYWTQDYGKEAHEIPTYEKII